MCELLTPANTPAAAVCLAPAAALDAEDAADDPAAAAEDLALDPAAAVEEPAAAPALLCTELRDDSALARLLETEAACELSDSEAEPVAEAAAEEMEASAEEAPD